ncbi:MAG: prepilin-type N-terminal cleavage/methylation domain-containing protein [Nitrospinae bacterium]|nr:prepilin-type N-terminal cleavage/methylation domain-containing protein [Nitrospinota bacterium]
MFSSFNKAIRGEKGFTLIELLVVVAIIGILVAIAIPQFSNYKKNANDSAAETDLRNMALAAEAYFATNNFYPGGAAGGNLSFTAAIAAAVCATPTAAIDNNLCIGGYTKMSKGNTMTFTSSATSPQTYTATATNSGGTGKIFTWDSSKGGLQ